MAIWRGQELHLLKDALVAAQGQLGDAEACLSALAALPPAVAGSPGVRRAQVEAEAALTRAAGAHRHACDAFCAHLRQRCLSLLIRARGARLEEAEEATAATMLEVTERWFQGGRLQSEWCDASEGRMSCWLAQAAKWRLAAPHRRVEAQRVTPVDDLEGPAFADHGQVPPTEGTTELLLAAPHKVFSCLVRSAGAVLDEGEPPGDHTLLVVVCKVRSHEAIRRRVDLWRRHHLEMVPIAQLAAEEGLVPNTVSGFVGHGAHALHVGGRRASRGDGLCTPLVTRAAALLVQYVPVPGRTA